ncbi:MAG: inositol monophosphatase [Patescibacteria group bacterium]|jgi:myo-inositol-1(or 4)-monophosphatase
MDKDIKNITRAAQAGGRVLKKYFGRSLRLMPKSTPADFRTLADINSEKEIIRRLTRDFPKYNIFAEESGAREKGSDYTFLIDPLDGTNNFILGIPVFSVSISLIRLGEIVAAVVHNPITGQTFYAKKGRGAFLNGKKLNVKRVADIRKASIAYNSSYRLQAKMMEGRVLKNVLAKKVKRILINWSPALDFCYLAQGKIEAIINNGCEIYDYSAGKLIAREAGALVTDLRGKPEKEDLNEKFLISNGTKLHKQILELI